MFRNVAKPRFNPLNLRKWQYPRRLASNDSNQAEDEEVIAARKWLAKLDADTIRQNAIFDISFSRSSGPGGQNVNKVSSKATLRIATNTLLPLLPKLLHAPILGSRYHAAKSGSLVLQADDSRKQAENVDTCFRKLHELLVQAGREAVPGETSEGQKKRVEELVKAEAGQRRKMKELRSKKKDARRAGGGRGGDD